MLLTACLPRDVHASLQANNGRYNVSLKHCYESRLNPGPTHTTRLFFFIFFFPSHFPFSLIAFLTSNPILVSIPHTMPGLHDTPALSDPQRKASSAIRIQWRLFEKWLAASRSPSDKRRDELCKALEDQFLASKLGTPPKYHVILQVEHDTNKADLRRKLDAENVQAARIEWDRRLKLANLNAEDWLDITPAECCAVERALGGDTTDPDDHQPHQPHPTPLPPPPPSIAHPLPSNGRSTAHQASLAHHHHGPFERVNPTAFRDERVPDDPFPIFHPDAVCVLAVILISPTSSALAFHFSARGMT